MSDANHWNGLCTNTFRRVYDANAKVSGDCEICVTPSAVVPPTSCNDCDDLPAIEGEWPSVYRIFGGEITTTDSSSGAYSGETENEVGIRTAYTFVSEWSWETIAELFNGGRLVRTETQKDVPTCFWGSNVVEATVMRIGAFFDQASGSGNCFTARNRPVSIDSFQAVGRNYGPALVAKTGDFASTFGPYMQLMNILSLRDENDGTPYLVPSQAKQWPTGFGVLSGTNLKAALGGNTFTDIFPDCPAMNSWYSAEAGLKFLDFRLLQNTPSSGQMEFQITMSHTRRSYATYYNKTTSKWQASTSGGFPAAPVVTTPSPPYGATYRGSVSCTAKKLIAMSKISTDTLGYYPAAITLVGE